MESLKEKFDALTVQNAPDFAWDSASPPPTDDLLCETSEASLSAKGSKLPPPDPRPHLNCVFIGHVDAGKSTTCGKILYATGQVDERTFEKYEREAKERNRDSWFLAYIMDTIDEERAKGKTQEVGTATFQTKNKRITILDAPGHKAFVPRMIQGASMADVAVLIISARKGEFETGFERGGQSREHTLLAKTLGVHSLIVAINKMDDQTCDWDQERYDTICSKLTPFFKNCGFSPKDIYFVPISGLSGQNIMHSVSDPDSPAYYPKADWCKGQPTLLEIFDSIPVAIASPRPNVIRMPIVSAYRDGGTMIVGKLEEGTITPNLNVLIMPAGFKAKILSVFIRDQEVAFAKTNEQLRLRLAGVEEDVITKGSVLCNIANPVLPVTRFRGRIAVQELVETRQIIAAGFSCVLHAHCTQEEVYFEFIHEVTDRKTKKTQKKPTFIKSESIVTADLTLYEPLCLEKYDDCPRLGRFTLRDEGKTIGIGKILEFL